jgi:fermentation-respiration switch protein FrsA (DUF1100 family)
MGMGKRIMHWLGLIAVCYGALLITLFVFQRNMLYLGSKEHPVPSEWGASSFEEVTTRTEDGVDLMHWYSPPADDCGPVVVVFHGNAGHIGYRVAKFAGLRAAGFGLFLSSYRGYGGNPGRPTETGLIADGRSVLSWLEAAGVAAGRTVLYGESLGAGVAIALAEKTPVGALVLEAPPSSIAEVAQAHYWYVPAKWLIWDKWNSLARIGAVEAPILLIHGARDRVVPQRFGRKLFEAANEPKEAVFPEKADHLNLLDDLRIMQRMVAFIQERAKTKGPKTPGVCQTSAP